jgi:hypothetical protein
VTKSKRDLRSQPGQGFGQQTRTATDVQRGLAIQRAEALLVNLPMLVDFVADIGEPHRVQLVQHGGGAIRVPPVARECPEVRSFVRQDACLDHGRLLTGRAD